MMEIKRKKKENFLKKPTNKIYWSNKHDGIGNDVI